MKVLIKGSLRYSIVESKLSLEKVNFADYQPMQNHTDYLNKVFPNTIQSVLTVCGEQKVDFAYSSEAYYSGINTS